MSKFSQRSPRCHEVLVEDEVGGLPSAQEPQAAGHEVGPQISHGVVVEEADEALVVGQGVGAGSAEDGTEGATGLVEARSLRAQDCERGREGVLEAGRGIIREERRKFVQAAA